MNVKIISNIPDPFYGYREHKNDLKQPQTAPAEWKQNCLRLAYASIPFINLYKPLSLPFSLVMGTSRVITSGSLLVSALRQSENKGISDPLCQTALSIISLAGTVFSHPMGSLLCTTHDLIIETKDLLKHLSQRDLKALENLGVILNNSLYLAVVLQGTLEILVLSFAVQTLVALYHSEKEFRAGHRIEGCAHLLMMYYRSRELHHYANLWAISKSIEREHPQASKELIRLIKDLFLDKKPFENLRVYWKKSALEQKDLFVEIFNSSKAAQFKSVREKLADLVYSARIKGAPVEWLSPDEVDERIGDIWKRVHGTSSPFYYHATSSSGLKGILRTKEVEVRHEKVYKGAFVSTQPEIGFGHCVLGFNRTIERKSSLLKSFPWFNAHWAGFGKGIAVTKESLSCLIWVPNSQYSLQQMKTDAAAIAGWDIPVISLAELQPIQSELAKINMMVPKEW